MFDRTKFFVRFPAFCLLVAVLSVCDLSVATAQLGQPSPLPGSVQPPGVASLPPVAFERPMLDFLTQGVGQENCVNVQLTNRTSKPVVLTLLRSLDAKHFRLNSPASEMMPMTLEPNSSVYINVCFKAEREKEFKSWIIAVVGSDTLRLVVMGRGVKQKSVGPLPQKLDLKILKPVKHKFDRTFSIDLPMRSTVTLEVRDILGKTVRKLLLNDMKSAGEYQVEFNWKDDEQKPLHAGTYVVRLEVNSLESHETDHLSQMITLKP